MSKIVRLTESDLMRLVKKVIKEQKNDENLMKEYELLLGKMNSKYSQACKTNFKKSTNFPFDPDIKKLQMLWNKLFRGDLKVDGIVGPQMKRFLCFPS